MCADNVVVDNGHDFDFPTEFCRVCGVSRKQWVEDFRPACATDMLAADNARMRTAGCALAEAAIYVCREYDGIHRLMLAVAEWSKAVADEGGRGLPS